MHPNKTGQGASDQRLPNGPNVLDFLEELTDTVGNVRNAKKWQGANAVTGQVGSQEIVGRCCRTCSGFASSSDLRAHVAAAIKESLDGAVQRRRWSCEHCQGRPDLRDRLASCKLFSMYLKLFMATQFTLLHWCASCGNLRVGPARIRVCAGERPLIQAGYPPT